MLTRRLDLREDMGAPVGAPRASSGSSVNKRAVYIVEGDPKGVASVVVVFLKQYVASSMVSRCWSERVEEVHSLAMSSIF